MSTTSTVPAVYAGLLAVFQAELPVPAFEAWPGPEAAREMVVFGRVEWDDYEIATIKAGRKHRQENYSIDFEVFVFGAVGTTPANPTVSKDRAFELFGLMEDVLATDVSGNTDFSIVQWVEIRPTEAEPRVFENGWAYRVAGRFEIHARLQ